MDTEALHGHTTHAMDWEKYWLEEKKRKKRRWNVFLILLICAASVACLVLLVNGQQIDYDRACKARTNKNFRDAIELFDSLGSYSDARQQRTNTVYAWADYAISSSTSYTATQFKDSVTLNATEYAGIYEKIAHQLQYCTDFDYWDDYAGNDSHSAIALALLETVPSTYKDTADWRELFGTLTSRSSDINDYIRTNISVLEKNWSVPFVKQLLQSDEGLAAFLEGYWYTSDNTYNMHYYATYSSYTYSTATYSTSFTSSLPTVSKPYSSANFIIKDHVQYWDSYSGRDPVYRFTFTDFDTVEVYCYEDSSTYTLYRR